MVRSGNVITLYKDMEIVGTVEIPEGTPNHKTYYLGVKRGLAEYFHGVIHCNAIYSGFLTSGEIIREVSAAFPLYEKIIINR